MVHGTSFPEGLMIRTRGEVEYRARLGSETGGGCELGRRSGPGDDGGKRPGTGGLSNLRALRLHDGVYGLDEELSRGLQGTDWEGHGTGGGPVQTPIRNGGPSIAKQLGHDPPTNGGDGNPGAVRVALASALGHGPRAPLLIRHGE